jgi:hypothetical protein
MPAIPNARHELFAQNIVKGMTSRDAYRAAGFKSDSDAATDASASRLLSSAKVSERIMELQAKAADETVLTKAWVIERLIRNVERAMTAEPVLDREGKPTGEYTYQGSVANRALELLGKEQGMFVDRKEVGKPGQFENLDNKQLDEAIARETRELMALDPEFAAAIKKAQKTQKGSKALN